MSVTDSVNQWVTFSAIVSKNHNTYGTLPLVKLAGTLSFASASWNLAWLLLVLPTLVILS